MTTPTLTPADRIVEALGSYGFTAEFRAAAQEWNHDRLRVRADLGAWLWVVGELTAAEDARIEANWAADDACPGEPSAQHEDDESRLYGRTADYILGYQFGYGTSYKPDSPACLLRRSFIRHRPLGKFESIEFGRSVLDGHDETAMIPVMAAVAEGLNDGTHFLPGGLAAFEGISDDRD